MNKVVNVNLNTRAYQIDEDGYTALKKYLDQAAHQLAHDPDKEEIIADFEQAIAEKCDQVLNKEKNVVTEAEMKSIITEMGPVAGEEESAEPSDQRHYRQFYLVKDGAIIGGVCNGIAAYFNLDVTVVRLLALLLAFVTSGAAIVAYIVVMIVAPVATTPEEKASARGAKFNSKQLLETARQKYAGLGDKEHWKNVAAESRPMLSRVGEFIRLVLRVVSGCLAALGIVTLLGLLVAGITAVWSLLISGQVFDIIPNAKISTTLLTMLIVSGLFVVAIPIFIVTAAASKYAKSANLRQSLWSLVVALCAFAVALSIGLAIVSTTPEIRDPNNYTNRNHLTHDSRDHLKVIPQQVVMPPPVAPVNGGQ